METNCKTNLKNALTEKSRLANYELLADLFMYPLDESFQYKIQNIYSYLSEYLPEAAISMNKFTEFASTSSIRDMQELFLRTFDLQAITTLDIGFILFGEDYKRGQLLVGLNQEHQAAGNDCKTELSDHLPNVLRLLPKMKAIALRNEIATSLVIPAVIKMRNEFDAEKIEKKNVIYKKFLKVILDYSEQYRTVYQAAFETLLLVLKSDFGDVEEPIVKKKGPCKGKSSCAFNTSEDVYTQGIGDRTDFSQKIESEILTEK